MENQKNSDYSAATKQDTQSWAGNTLVRRVVLMVSCVSTATLLLVLILEPRMTSQEKPIGPNPTVPRSTGASSKPRRFLAWVATSAARGRLEVLFIEQKSLREQLTEILQEIEDYTWTDEGLANFSIKISRKGQGLETSYSILPKVRKVPEKIKAQWAKEKETIWLPNYFEGKDPFDGKQTDSKGLPASVDKRGSTVLPKTEEKKQEQETEF